jgi:hypothetical protein
LHSWPAGSSVSCTSWLPGPKRPHQAHTPAGHPLAWLDLEQAPESISEERRRELIELGFPDDGYDYLKHLRTVSHGSARMEVTDGPSTLRTNDVFMGAEGNTWQTD